MRTIASLLFVLAIAAHAQATTVVLERDGVAVPNGQVCHFAADDRDNPFKRWLMATEVTCVPAGSTVTFPSGLWNVFARIDGQAIGAPRLIDGSRAPSTLKFALSEAAAITTDLPPDRRGFFYAPRLAYAIPAEPRTTVPAGEELWLFIVENQKKEEGKLEVLNLLSVPAVEAGTAQPLQPRPGATSNVIGWVHVPAELRATVRKLRTPPKVFGTTPARTVVDGDPMPATPLLHGSFVRVRGLQAGGANLALGGEGWLASAQPTTVAETVNVAPSALVARPAGSLLVNWSRVKDLVLLNFTIAACERDGRQPRLEIVLTRCRTPLAGEGYDPSTCREVSRTPDDVRKPHGSFAINELAPGFYQAEMRYGLLPPVAGTATVVAQEQRALYVRADYDQLFGTVTRASKPIEASTLAFDGKTGAGATRPLLRGTSLSPWMTQGRRSESDSRPQDPAERRKILEDRFRTFEASYQAVVRALPQTDSTIEIAACKDDSRITVLADRPAIRGERFDIVVPDNEIVFRVIDTYTQARLGAAAIRYTVLSKSEPHTTVLTGTLWTAKEGDPVALATNGEAIGTAKLASVPVRKTTFAVSYPGYERQTLGPFTIVEGEKRRIEVQMVPLRGGQSKIGSPTAFVNGAVYWYTRDGVQTEVAELAPDGTFFTLGSHDSAETMAVISESHPLWVSRSPRLDGRRAVTIAFPELRPREFHVVVDEDTDNQPRYVGLVVGGLRVPQAALAQHQALYGERAVVHGSRPLQVSAIGETGPIDVLLGPPVDEVPSRWQGMDLFTLPKYQDVPRQRLGAESSGVVFDE